MNVWINKNGARIHDSSTLHIAWNFDFAMHKSIARSENE